MLVEIAYCCECMIEQLYSQVGFRIYHDHASIDSHSFGLKLLGVQCKYEHRSIVVLIEPTLVLFPPSNGILYSGKLWRGF